MPGPGNKNKGKANRQKVTQKTSAGSPADSNASNKASALCLTLLEDEMTRCEKPATDGFPVRNRCKEHQAQYVKMYKKYKDAANVVDRIKQGGSIPTLEQIARYTEVRIPLEKARFMRDYVEAIRVERIGRDIHSRRFFLKVDDGHKIRLKVLAKEMIRGVEILDNLQSKAYDLYVQKNPFPEWLSADSSQENQPFEREPLSAENKIKFASEALGGPDNLNKSGGYTDNNAYLQPESADLIDLELRSRKEKILYVFEFCLRPDSIFESVSKSLDGGSSDYVRHQTVLCHKILSQYALRIIFHEPTLFMKSVGKVSLKDLLLSDDLTLEDIALFFHLFSKKLEFGLLLLKDSILEAITMIQPGSLGTAANVGATGNRIKILDGWIFNVAHVKEITNEAWHVLINMTEPPANVENRFVRLCNTYDDLIGFLSFGALGMVPPPSFCAGVVAYRNHLSLAGVIVADMASSPKQPALCGPVPSTHRAKKAGCTVWAELETRAYIFGAVRNEPDAFTDSFLNEIKARPDLFHFVIHSESDPIGRIEASGGSAGPLPHIRCRNFEAPRASPNNRPTGYGEWTIPVSAADIFYGTNREHPGGYLTKLTRGDSSGWFFHFKKFKVKYFAVIDPIPNRHHTFLAQNLAWVALRVKGYGKGEYEQKKYREASDAFFDKCAAERLAWMPKSAGGWRTTKMT